MNIETFHAISSRVINAFQRTDLANKLSQLVSAFQNRVNHPAEPSYAQQADNLIDELRKALPGLETNKFPPLWKEYIREINSSRWIGDDLLPELNEILMRNGITPSLALTELKSISDEISQDLIHLTAANNALERFGIEKDEPEAGTVEIGILVPRAAVHERLAEFGAELRKLSRILAVFHEATHGDRPDVKLKTIASSEFSLLCLLDWETAKLITKSLADIIEGYKIILKLKQQIESLRDAGVPEANLEGVIKHANESMQTTVAAISEEIITRFPDGRIQEARKKELKIEIKGALGELATRIDKGFSFEIRPGAPKKPKGDEASDTGAIEQYEIQNRESAEIAAFKSTLQFLKTDQTPILALPGLPAAEQEPPKRTAKQA